jgi:hypothetical protein
VLASVLLLFGVLAVSVVGPGLFLCSRLRRWRPLEKLCAAVAVSLLIQFLLGFAIYTLDLGLWWHYLGAAVGLAGTALSAKDLLQLARTQQVKRAAVSYAVVFLVGLLTICIIRDLAGGEWFGDWAEHFQRTGFWLGKFPTDHKFIGAYALPARPPMMNVLCASLMAQCCPTGVYPFAAYQLALLLLNALIILPVALITRAVWPRGRRYTPLAVALLLLNPMFVQNLSYPWTRHLTTFYVLTAIALYLTAWRKGSMSRMVAAFLASTTAMLVHYSAGPYLLFLVLHYLIALWWRRPKRWEELATIMTSCALVLGTWVGWSIHTYGPAVTFGANSVITDSSQFSAEGNVLKILGNTYRTVVPLFLRATPDTIQRQTSALGFARDYAFVTYQQNAIFALGSVGALIALVLIFRIWKGKGRPRGEPLFWLSMIVVVGFLGIAVNGTPDWYGYAHIVLQPLIYTGICLIAAGVPSLRPAWCYLLLVGLFVDFWLGIFLQLAVETYTGQAVLSLSPAAISNYEMKLQGHMVLLGDRVGDIGGPLLALLVLLYAVIFAWLARRLTRHNPPLSPVS